MKYKSVFLILSLAIFIFSPAQSHAEINADQVKQAIEKGKGFLRSKQKRDGTFGDMHPVGYTAFVTLAFATAGEPADSATLAPAISYLRRASTYSSKTYEIALQTMALSTTSPKTDLPIIRKNVDWLVKTQGKNGTWGYGGNDLSADGDNSNTQFALLALYTADEAGIRVPPETFLNARHHWETTQGKDGGWGYSNYSQKSYGSMTTAGIASLIITGVKGQSDLETLDGVDIKSCGIKQKNVSLARAMEWMATNFDVKSHPFGSAQYLYYYLYAMERAGRLSGQRYFGDHDWYQKGAAFLLENQSPVGSWSEGNDELLGTVYALLFLAKGKAPVLINKLVHEPVNDWNHDSDDIRNLVAHMSQVFKQLLVWQIVDPNVKTLTELEQAPIAFLNGHEAPVFSDAAKERLRQYIDGGGFLIVDACCHDTKFDAGFRALMKEIFPDEGSELKPIPPDHEIWRIHHRIDPSAHPLWGIQRACRMSVVYSPTDLSCYWNQLHKDSQHPLVTEALNIGENIVAYATGDSAPPDKLSLRPVESEKEIKALRGTLQIAKIKHAGDWDLGANAIPNLMRHLNGESFEVMISQRGLFLSDANLRNFPLAYLHGRRDFSFTPDEIAGLRNHVRTGGTVFADALCGSEDFDAAFRRMMAEAFPDNPLEVIPADHEIFQFRTAHDIRTVEYNEKIDGQPKRALPHLEGIRIDKQYPIIYSKYDLGCALQKTPSPKGYTYASALDISCNIVHYSMLP